MRLSHIIEIGKLQGIHPLLEKFHGELAGRDFSRHARLIMPKIWIMTTDTCLEASRSLTHRFRPAFQEDLRCKIYG